MPHKIPQNSTIKHRFCLACIPFKQSDTHPPTTQSARYKEPKAKYGPPAQSTG
jgi:hypothetical protein